MKILYKPEATNPEAKVRENITLDIKDGAALKRPRPHSPTSHYTTLPCSKLHTPDTTPLYITLHDIAPLGITLPDIVVRDVPLHDITLPKIILLGFSMPDVILNDITLLDVTLPEITLPDI